MALKVTPVYVQRVATRDVQIPAGYRDALLSGVSYSGHWYLLPYRKVQQVTDPEIKMLRRWHQSHGHERISSGGFVRVLLEAGGSI